MAEHAADARRPKPSGDRGTGTMVFAQMGPTLALLRSLTGKPQAQVARETRIGKSQLSKYEGGRELPKLESLGRLLQTLGVTHLEFAYTLAVVQQRAERLASHSPVDVLEDPALLLAGKGLVGNPLDDAIARLVEDLLVLHRRCFEVMLFRETP